MITVVFDLPGVNAAQYEEACRLANVSADNVPDGLIFHSASPTETGWLVVDTWESVEKFHAFGERLMPAIQKAGMPDVQPRIYKTHNVMAGLVPSAV